MPDGIYLNANTLSGEEMAEKMMEAIRDKERYYSYFKWHEHYRYYMASESADTDPLCTFCAFLNKASKKNQRRVYARFTDWWNDSKDIKRDTIVNFSESINKTAYKSFIYDPSVKITNLETVIKDEPSVVQTFVNIVGELFRYYFY